MPTIDEYLKTVSDDTKRLNPGLFESPATDRAICAPPGAEPQPVVRNEPLGPQTRKAFYTGRCKIRVTSVRTRLLDPDNLCAKYFVDSLRYAGLIADDTSKEVEYTICQRKKTKFEEEHTTIEVIPI